MFGSCTVQIGLVTDFVLVSDADISESAPSITKRPQNVIVQKDENAILNCSTDSTSPQGRNTILWKHDLDLIVHRECKLTNYPAFVVSLPNPQTDCNIIALAGKGDGISGPYECNDGISDPKSVAMVIVLSKLTIT